MPNSKRVLEYLDAVTEELLAMPNDEFVALVKNEEELMKQAIIKGHDHLGLALWSATDPEACKKYVDEVLEEHARNGKETT